MSTEDSRIVFLFSGQGAQYPGMGRDLYAVAPVFRRWIDECAAHLQPRLGRDIRTLLLADPSDEAAQSALRDTAVTQPALFTIEYALAQQWIAWGIRPAVLLGHSIGEYTAACLAGVFSLADALALVAERGRLMSRLPGGAMMSVAAAAERVLARLPPGVDLAAINAPELCVVAGSAEALDNLATELTREGIACRPLHVSHAFHSAHMDPMLAPFAEQVRRIARGAPQIPIISNVTGGWLTAEEATDPGYWTRHVRATVRFAAGLDTAFDQSSMILLEVGPGRSLITFARACARNRAPLLLQSLPHPEQSHEGLATMLQSLGRLWLRGIDLDWQAIHAPAPRRRVPLPTYPFERRRHWIEAGAHDQHVPGGPGRLPQSRWLSQLLWESLPAPASDTPDDAGTTTTWLLCARSDAPARALESALGARGQRVSMLDPSALHDPAAWPPPASSAARVRLIYVPDDAAEHAWAAGAGDLVQAIPRVLHALSDSALTVSVVAARSLALGPSEPISPAHAGARGALTVLGQEFPELRTQWIDTDFDHPAWAEAAAGELVHGRTSVIALRGYQRFAPRHEPVVLPRPVPPAFTDNGVYLVTGGTGAIGQALALYLARTYRARVALIGRAITAQGDTQRAGDLTQLEQRIQAAGGEALSIRADVTRADELGQAIDAVQRRWGHIDGVIHAAGVAGDAAVLPCADTTAESWARIADVKEQGTRVLAHALAPHRPPWVLVMSSLSAVLGGLGLAAYASANIAQDALVHQLNRSSPTRWYGVNWDGWTPPGQPTDETTIRPEEGFAVIEQVVGQRGVASVAVAVSDLEERRRQWIERAWRDDVAVNQVERPRLDTDYVAPRNQTEEKLAAIWSELLGIAEIGIHDDFFELGGHSLLATQVAARIRAAFHIDVPIRALFEKPTIAALAELVAPADLARRLRAPVADDDQEREEIEL